ncbi:MAG: hypothetical protein KJZ65_13845 [Phycisphaerales bacterium]|nr:hypothetical protein [Phycisphaerales bacterium]
MKVGLTVCCVGAVASAAVGGIATFDSFTEGVLGWSFWDAGIHFYNPDNYTPEGSRFICERADGTLSGPYFSSPNALTLTGYVPGPNAGYSRVGSFYASVGGPSDYARVEVFYFYLTSTGNTISMEALRNGVVVGSDSFVVTTPFQAHRTLEIDGPEFDEIRIVGSGPNEAGAMFALFDNFEIRGVPAPVSALVLVLPLVGRRRR